MLTPWQLSPQKQVESGKSSYDIADLQVQMLHILSNKEYAPFLGFVFFKSKLKTIEKKWLNVCCNFK